MNLFLAIFGHHSLFRDCRNENVSDKGARRAFSGVLLILLSILAALPANAHEQKKGIPHRTVHGTVVDKDENPAASSVVYLMDLKSHTAQTCTTGDTGTYQFDGLDPNMDYEVHAEHGDLVSATRTVSSFDSRLDVEIILKLSHSKTAH